MKNMHRYKIHFLMILIVPSVVQAMDWKRERKRQAQIAALLTAHQNNKPKKTDDFAQRLLDGEQEECERKISADHVPIAPLARPGRQTGAE